MTRVLEFPTRQAPSVEVREFPTPTKNSVMLGTLDSRKHSRLQIVLPIAIGEVEMKAIREWMVDTVTRWEEADLLDPWE